MDYIKILEDILAMDTTVPPGRNYEKVIDYLQPLFQEVGCETQKVAIPPEHASGQEGRVNLVAHRRQPGKPRLIFYGHIDVVPAQGWAAFSPRIESGKIYGRGAADMKGSIVGLLLGLSELKNQSLNYDVSVMITTDEEAYQADQLRYLKNYLESVAGAYFFNLDASFGYVGVTNLGVLQADIIVKGKSVHSAMSHRGENAVEKASLVMAALLKLKTRVEKRKSRINTHPGTGLEKMIGRLNINMIQGGLKVNVVPDQCIISIDRRLIPEETIEVAKQELITTLSAVKGVDWELDKIVVIPTVMPTESPVVDKLAYIIGDVAGQTGKYGEMGSGDLPHIVVEWGGQEFGLGVIRAESNIHGKDEFAYIEDIEALARIIQKFLTA